MDFQRDEDITKGTAVQACNPLKKMKKFFYALFNSADKI